MKNLCAAAAVLLLLVTTSCTSKTDPALTYPVAKKVEVVDEYFGIKVPDPYRWMEDLDSKDNADWVAAENKVTFDYLGRLAMRDRLKQRITELWDFPKVSVPAREGGRYFYRKNSGLQRRSASRYCTFRRTCRRSRRSYSIRTRFRPMDRYRFPTGKLHVTANSLSMASLKAARTGKP